ncbi:hypothetical protein KFK09_002248 [Dendrobium nobile]|uniref:Uncharacterized protein n=1 Tax=Dendrobium nobile TaxID=94219 RepID=A0A8T3C7F0_DENNO|nr:hypothetical protein KFK09_002248 [Dendrobium nobile]
MKALPAALDWACGPRGRGGLIARRSRVLIGDYDGSKYIFYPLYMSKLRINLQEKKTENAV